MIEHISSSDNFGMLLDCSLGIKPGSWVPFPRAVSWNVMTALLEYVCRQELCTSYMTELRQEFSSSAAETDAEAIVHLLFRI